MPPLNLIGDFGGGGMLLAFGVVCALLEARMSGKGQVVDAAMVDGSALLMSPIYGCSAQGTWKDERGVNVLDTGAPYYNVYRDQGRQVGLDRLHRAALLRGLLDRLGLPARICRSSTTAPGWPDLRAPFRRGLQDEDPRRSGRTYSRAATRALRRCCLSPRWRTIRTMPSARHFERATA